MQCVYLTPCPDPVSCILYPCRILINFCLSCFCYVVLVSSVCKNAKCFKFLIERFEMFITFLVSTNCFVLGQRCTTGLARSCVLMDLNSTISNSLCHALNTYRVKIYLKKKKKRKKRKKKKRAYPENSHVLPCHTSFCFVLFCCCCCFIILFMRLDLVLDP